MRQTTSSTRKNVIIILSVLLVIWIPICVVAFFVGQSPVSSTNSVTLTATPTVTLTTTPPATTTGTVAATVNPAEVKISFKEIGYDDFVSYIRSSQGLSNSTPADCLKGRDFCPQRIIVKVKREFFVGLAGCLPGTQGDCPGLQVVVSTDDGRLLPLGTIAYNQSKTYIEGLASLQISGFGKIGLGNVNNPRFTERLSIDAGAFYLLQTE